MINPIALIIIAIGIMLMVSGIFLTVKGMKTAGLLMALVGLGLTAFPFLISYILAE